MRVLYPLSQLLQLLQKKSTGEDGQSEGIIVAATFNEKCSEIAAVWCAF